jgi:hypothetical protein
MIASLAQPQHAGFGLCEIDIERMVTEQVGERGAEPTENVACPRRGAVATSPPNSRKSTFRKDPTLDRPGNVGTSLCGGPSDSRPTPHTQARMAGCTMQAASASRNGMQATD